MRMWPLVDNEQKYNLTDLLWYKTDMKLYLADMKLIWNFLTVSYSVSGFLLTIQISRPKGGEKG